MSSPQVPHARKTLNVKLLDYLRGPGAAYRNARVLVACSGGPDSLVLLHALVKAGVALSVATVDHGLREASARECEAVVTVGAKLGVPVEVLRLAMPSATPASARTRRYEALLDAAQRGDATAIAVGHTVDDQLETFLDHVVRGSGLRGLAGMPIARALSPDVTLIRPLLAAKISRAEVLAYVAAAQLSPAHDPSNQNVQRRRARLRHEVIPLLQREHPQLAHAVAALCERVRADDDLLTALSLPLDVTDRRALLAAPAPLVVRALDRLVGHPLWAEQHRQIAALLQDGNGSAELHLDGKSRFVRRYDRIAIEPASAPITSLPTIMRAGDYVIGEHTITIDDALFARVRSHAPGFRQRAPGDRFRWRGHERKLSDVFINGKVPRSSRLAAIVLDAATGLRASREIHAVFLVGDRGPSLPAVVIADDSAAMR